MGGLQVIPYFAYRSDLDGFAMKNGIFLVKAEALTDP